MFVSLCNYFICMHEFLFCLMFDASGRYEKTVLLVTSIAFFFYGACAIVIMIKNIKEMIAIMIIISIIILIIIISLYEITHIKCKHKF